MNVHDEFTRRVAADRLCRELARAIAENDTAALERLGMRGFGLYAGRLSELMTDSVRRELLGTDDFGAIMGEVAKPAHYAHHLVNEGGSAIQQALDRRNGVRLRVVEPEFNDGRLKGIVGQIAESDSENAPDNLATQLGTFVKDMGNEFMRQNAEQRDRAGFKVTITRTGGAKCCPWCADRTGTWELKAAPDGVFGCHDNCKCMVDYTNSKGTVRGKAVGKKWNFSEIPYEPPRVLTREEAAARGGFDKPRRLTGDENRGIIGLGAKIGGDRFVPLHEEPKPIKTINPNDKASVLAEIAVFEKWAANSAIENACVITRNGEVYYCFGIEDRVFVDYDLGDKLTGAFVSHNHVKGISEYSFSNDDFDLFIAYSLKLLRGIDNKYEYELSNDYSDVPSEPEILTYEDSQHFMTIRSAESYGVGYRRWLR